MAGGRRPGYVRRNPRRKGCQGQPNRNAQRVPGTTGNRGFGQAPLRVKPPKAKARKVKVCPYCDYMNNPRRLSCEKCRTLLSSVQTTEFTPGQIEEPVTQ